MINFVEELRWRGLLHDMIPETETHLLENKTTGYIGFDPTADSLHVGSLVQILILMHFQRAGHKPIALIGGATGMIGDPSGKSAERNLLDEATLTKNITGIKNQLTRFLDFDIHLENAAELVNNYDWMKPISLIDFVRDTGKHITVNYMIAKDSVKKRLGAASKEGMSFTEFTYQLFQGYDFYHLYKEKNCTLQMGGADQWGNITTGTELIRRKTQRKAYAITVPLVTKADGTKFGKTEGGNVWLDTGRTSPYKFYQYWLNISDEDAEKYIRIFTFLSREAIDALITKHKETPHLRLLQKKIGEEITIMVHGKEAYENAIKASAILFGKSTARDLKLLNEQTFLEVFDGVPQAIISKKDMENGLGMIDALAAKTGFMTSNGDARRALKENAIAVNKEKVKESFIITTTNLISEKYVLLQRGKKNYFLLKII
ncbi:MAG: tyrosine--tRNA ligase [Flavobacteriaceae bacterium]|nr:MAG: tyrosine--tRNA ligase [Flavobacteriaceae bacterium]